MSTKTERKEGKGEGTDGEGKTNINHVVQSVMYCSLERSGERGVCGYLVWFGMLWRKVFLKYDIELFLYSFCRTEVWVGI